MDGYAQTNFKPEVPAQLSDRGGDNWRSLRCIAGAISPQAGDAARQAAVAMNAQQDEDIGVILVGDIILFDTLAMIGCRAPTE
jgi:hypothetical protein